MKLKPEELQVNGYILLDSMDHNELVPFVKKFINKRTWSSVTYYLSIFISLGLLVFFCVKPVHSGSLKMNKVFLPVSLGIVFSFVLIPFHELIHALAYKLQGAKQTSYDVNLKKFYFLAMADKFVASKREFQLVALAPFIIISITLLITFFFSGELFKIAMLSTLLMHSTFCSGDFALLSYFEFNKNKEIVTYDDKENKISFFYGKEDNFGQ